MQARTRVAGSKGTRPVHTLNGSGLAVGRTLLAIVVDRKCQPRASRRCRVGDRDGATRDCRRDEHEMNCLAHS